MRPDDEVSDFSHIPVMLEQVMHFLNLSPGDTALDSTLGGAGHGRHIAQAISPGGTLIGIDRDGDAIRAAGPRLVPFTDHCNIILKHCAFDKIAEVVAEVGAGSKLRIKGCLMDLGASSFQFDHALGFSFRRDEYLDGRMNREGDEPTIADIIARSGEAELAQIMWELGDERFSRAISRKISAFKAAGNVLETTFQLVKIVEESIPRVAWPKDIHVATKVFQSLRMACNGEIHQLRTGLEAAIDALAPTGRIVCISFHSKEDAIVKSIFARRSGKVVNASSYSPQALMPNIDLPEADLKLLTRKPVMADAQETALNARSRSAKVRAAVRIS